ncbi:DUF2513 domain-containing protein [Streptococcus dysgalactiae]|uniref:DUF2513 domain-containing protein n=1 Tax=Streptococcus dysgalactiae TaxID=1334 RepID=UPI000DFB6E4B|nr:DUF2513 domain-containing protein [Streptococcus dysgalactiae]QQT02899.1 DUF2513 domain-containing protein [Streptococcus dysgalactiae]SUN44610.1 Uncharacterised protein [Streptococcus dysgalactiae subsp. dysgalactiae]SUN49073.1 Uncharacterised protein [Streptococcus dysgalactiae]
MKLNPDCIRDILLNIEERADYGNYALFASKEEFAQLPEYSANEIMYHIRQCDNSGFFLGKVSYFSEGCIVKDLSPLGHEFLANIRQDSNWSKTKDIAKNVGSTSLDVLKDISAQVISNLISGQFNK